MPLNMRNETVSDMYSSLPAQHRSSLQGRAVDGEEIGNNELGVDDVMSSGHFLIMMSLGEATRPRLPSCPIGTQT